MDLKEFKDLSDEQFRQYTFQNPSGNGTTFVSISNPLKLHVSASGGHRVLDADGISHYIPPGWIHLCWKVKDGRPPFAF